MKSTKTKEEKKEIEELKGQLDRDLEDYENLQKRIEKEKGEWIQFAKKSLITKFLPIYDMILSAQKHLNDTGIAMVVSNFDNILADEGVEIIRPKEGDDFNEEFHEAIDIQEVDDLNKAGKISTVILPGFRFKDGLVIRHAKVNVFKKK